MDVTTRRVRLEHDPSIELCVHESGSESATPVVLLHGFPDGNTTWSLLQPDLTERGYHVLAPQQRGYGQSSAPRSVLQYTQTRLLRDIADLIYIRAGGRAAHIVAHDWGGALSWEFARSYPTLVRTLTVLNCPHRKVLERALWTDPEQRRRSSYIFLFQMPWLPERRLRPELLRSYVLEHASPHAFSTEDLEAMERTWAAGMRGPVNWYRAAPISRRTPAPSDVLGRIVSPTQLIWGEKDHALGPELAEPSIERCTDGSVIRVPEGGHWVHRDCPGEVHEAIFDHLSAHGGVDPMLYKIVDIPTWTRAGDPWRGTELDRTDRFIHLSAASQLEGTLEKWFERDRDDLLLLAIAPERLPAGALHWEVSRNGQRFPHLYGPLPKSAIERVEPLRWEADHYGLPVAVRVRHNASA